MTDTRRRIDLQVSGQDQQPSPESRLTEEDNTERRKGLNIPR
jgi:hypothetical protein